MASLLGGALVCVERRPMCCVRLVAFPPAGAGPGWFRSWRSVLPPWGEMWCVCPPGRELRFSEAPLRNVIDMVHEVVPALRLIQDVPLAFLGHSMGALVSWEAARVLASRGDPLPVHLFLSAYSAPSIPRGDTAESRMADDDLVARVGERYGGFPEEIRDYPEALQMALGSLRADLEALETHQVHDAPALPIPTTVMGARQDPSVPVSELQPWAREIDGPFLVETFEGNHGYLAAAPRGAVSLLVRRLRTSLGETRITLT